MIFQNLKQTKTRRFSYPLLSKVRKEYDYLVDELPYLRRIQRKGRLLQNQTFLQIFEYP